MRTNRSYVPEDSVFPLMGLNTLNPSSQIPPSYSPKMMNMDVVKGIMVKRRGFEPLGAEQDEPCIGITEFETLEGTKILVKFTFTKQWMLDTSTDTPTWVEITTREDDNSVYHWTG